MTIRTRAEAEAIRHNAIARLASARREALTKQDFDVYCDGLQWYDPDIVARVCRECETTEPGEYQPRFPPLHVLISKCETYMRQARESKQAKQLKEAKPTISNERMIEILAQAKAMSGRKEM